MAGSLVAVGAVYYVVQATASDGDLLDLDNIELSQSSLVVATDPDTGAQVEYATLRSSNSHRVWADLEQIPTNLQYAFICTEDKDFYNEPGVNFKRTIGAMINEYLLPIYSSKQGASTLEQQLIKNLTSDKSASGIEGALRKLREIYRALILSRSYSKETILEAYLNTISFTGTIQGVQTAANEYFDKDVSELTLWECASIASITKNPTNYNPYTNPENLINRRNFLLYNMWQQGVISEDDYRSAAAQPLVLAETDNTKKSSSTTSYFTDALFNEVVKDIMAKEGVDESTAQSMLYTGGYTIEATVNPKIQTAMENLMLNTDDAYFPAGWHEEEVTSISDDDVQVFNEDGTPIFDASYTYTTKSGVKVGFFGMETPETQTKANPALIKGLTFADKDAFTKAAADQVAALKDEDVVICLAHLGVDAESAPYRSTDLYAAVKGIDFIVDGHSHTVMTKGEKGEPIQSTGTAFKNIGVIVIDDASKKIESNSLYEIKEDTAKDATVAAAAKTIADRVNNEYGVKFATSKVELNGAKAPNGNRDVETNNGDLITDAMRWKVLQNKDGLTVNEDHVVAITNGGGIRAAIAKGDVTKKDINTVLPFGNTVAVVYVTGEQLLEALEASTFSTPTAVGGFPQVSGINFTIHTGKAYDKNDATYPESTYYGPKTINRVVINSVNGKEFKANEVYAVVTNNFCAAGGDTYYAFKAASAQFDTGIPLDEAVMEYVTKELKGVIGEQYAAPQGRITYFNPFKDVKTTSWYFNYMIHLYEDGVISGTSATTYTPDAKLSWAAALKLLLVSHGDLKAADATGADWSKNVIAKAAELGLVAADLDGTKAISRLEFCQVAAKLNKLAESKTESKFTDCTDGYVMALVDAKVINGMTETTFEPDASLTRAQIAKIIYQLNLIEK